MTPQNPRAAFPEALRILCLLLALAAVLPQLRDPGHAHAQGLVGMDAPIDIETDFYALPDDDPGSTLLRVRLAPHGDWYIYSNQPGELGLATQVTVTSPEGEAFPAFYPPGVEKPDPLDPAVMSNVYVGPVNVYVPLPPLPAGTELSIAADGLLCSDVSCLPMGEVRTTAFPEPGELRAAQNQPWWEEYHLARSETADGEPVATTTFIPTQTTAEDLANPDAWPAIEPRFFQPGLEVGSLAKALLFALIAGLVLNVMPCVLPVISLKLSGLVAGQSEADPTVRRAVVKRYNLWFAAGIVVYFAVLSVIVGALGLVWGQIFQEPVVVLVLAALVFALGLALAGVFHLPVIDLGAAGPQGKQHKASGAFATGLFATLLATPCSGPLLGGVLAWTMQRPAIEMMLVFVAVGVGMALPYLYLAFNQGAMRLLPKPGPWLGVVEKVVAFFLFATTIYLLSILPTWMGTGALVVLLAVGIAAFIWGGTANARKVVRFGWRAAGMAIIVAATAWALSPPSRASWETFSADDFRAMLGQTPIIADFTADWCPNCKFLEQTVLAEDNLTRWQAEYGLRAVKVDLTEANPSGQALLRALGSRSIPVVAIFPDGEDANEPIVLRDLFTEATMEEALEAVLGED
jgi:thiol:disulfide interchange protein DsbD